jgi:hypothetical protein
MDDLFVLQQQLEKTTSYTQIEIAGDSLLAYLGADVVAIYLVNDMVSPNVFKKVLNGNTRADIATLFAIESDGLPENKARYQPDPILEFLFDIYGQKVYAYRQSGGRVRIFPISVTEESRVRHGRPVNLGLLSTDFGMSGSKGWQIGVFHGRDYPIAMRQEDPLRPMFALLGLEVTATEQEVKHAYRRLAHIYHPDLSREPGATQRMQRINAAYEAIMRRFA